MGTTPLRARAVEAALASGAIGGRRGAARGRGHRAAGRPQRHARVPRASRPGPRAPSDRSRRRVTVRGRDPRGGERRRASPGGGSGPKPLADARTAGRWWRGPSRRGGRVDAPTRGARRRQRRQPGGPPGVGRGDRRRTRAAGGAASPTASGGARSRSRAGSRSTRCASVSPTSRWSAPRPTGVSAPRTMRARRSQSPRTTACARTRC